MAQRTTKSSNTTRTARSTEAAAAPSPPRRPPQAASDGNPNRLLREAAWSRMFGRVEAKNPFAR
jgi:hypothetical protein